MRNSLMILHCFILITLNSFTSGQNVNIMYFCESYETGKGEINSADRFTRGSLTVIVNLAKEISFNKLNIQIDLYDKSTGKFEYFRSEEYDVDPAWDYIHFDNVRFNKKGIFRVFLLSPQGETITSALVEIF